MSLALYTDKKRKWKIFQKQGKIYFWYHKNTHLLENAKSKEECHVFADKDNNNFVILILNKEDDFAGITYLNKDCEIIWEKNFSNVSDYWEKNNTKVKNSKPFFQYSPVFQARILIIGYSYPGKIKEEENEIKEFFPKEHFLIKESTEEVPEDFFKDWKPFCVGFSLGIIYFIIGLMIFHKWYC